MVILYNFEGFLSTLEEQMKNCFFSWKLPALCSEANRLTSSCVKARISLSNWEQSKFSLSQPVLLQSSPNPTRSLTFIVTAATLVGQSEYYFSYLDMEFQSLEIPPLLLTQLVYFIKQNIMLFHLYNLLHFSFVIHTLDTIMIIIIDYFFPSKFSVSYCLKSLIWKKQEFKDFPSSFWPSRIPKTLKENEYWTEHIFGLSKSDWSFMLLFSLDASVDIKGRKNYQRVVLLLYHLCWMKHVLDISLNWNG